METGARGAGSSSGASVAPAQQQQQAGESMKLTSRSKSQSSSQSSINSENLYTKNFTFFELFQRSILKNVLLVSTIGAVFFGTLIGLFLRNYTTGRASPDLVQLWAFPGDMFLRMLKMLILPLIIASVISALASLDTTVSGKVGMRACLLYMTTTVMATITGIILVTIIHPGDVKMKASFDGPKSKSFGPTTWARTSFSALPRLYGAHCKSKGRASYKASSLGTWLCLLFSPLPTASLRRFIAAESLKRARARATSSPASSSISRFASPVAANVSSGANKLGAHTE